MSADPKKIYTASSQQWRFIEPNRPSGMAPLVSSTLVEKEKQNTSVKSKDQNSMGSGAYYYSSYSDHDSDQHSSDYYYNRNPISYSGKEKTNAQSRLSKYKN